MFYVGNPSPFPLLLSIVFVCVLLGASLGFLILEDPLIVSLCFPYWGIWL